MRKYIYNIANLIRKIGFDLNERNDKRVIAMQKEISKIEKIEFKIEQYPDGSWTAESINIDGIITGGKTTKNISVTIKDAVFTYFEIPSYLCADVLLKGDNEPVTLTQSVYA
ncbi:MAG: hypothetical protein U9Q85_03620 [Patescibacteria group bacterium]|nr:hypothetical protein [Patescibacteria group bacterium]